MLIFYLNLLWISFSFFLTLLPRSSRVPYRRWSLTFWKMKKRKIFAHYGFVGVDMLSHFVTVFYISSILVCNIQQFLSYLSQIKRKIQSNEKFKFGNMQIPYPSFPLSFSILFHNLNIYQVSANEKRMKKTHKMMKICIL